MPIYKVNGKTYDIPEEKVARFETAYPDAVVGIYDGGTGKEYEMPVSKVDKFKKTFPEWSYSRPAASGTSSGEGQEADSPGMAAVTDNVGTSGDERESTSGNKEEWKPTPIQKALMTGGIQASMARFDAKVDEGKRHLEEMAQYTNSGAAMTGGQVRDAGVAMDTGTGEAVKRYQTPTGELTTDRVGAEREASAYREAVSNMTVAGQLRRAGRDLEDLQRKREARVKEIHDKWAADQERNTAPLAAVLGAQTYTPSIEADTEYRALTAAIHQAEKRIQALQHESDRQEGKDVGFWRGFGEVVGDIKTWDFGYSDLLDAMTMLDATSKPSPNRPAKTDTQKEAEQTMLEQTYETQQAQSTYGQNDSFWNRAGVMTGEMLPFMLDFAIMGGAKGGTSMVTRNLDAVLLRSLHKAAPKVARNKAVQWTTKALGAMPEDLLYRAPLMTNTVQGMKTSADIIDRKLGDVVIRDDGTYDFSNDKTWGSAIWQGEANAIIENYSEMFGTHLEGVLSLKTVGKLADTFGAKRLSGILTKASNSELAGIAGTMQKHLNQLGVSDYFGEVGEEYYGQLWRTMLDLDDAYKQNPDGSRTNLFLDGQFHGDIWGGMALSMGLLGAGKYSISAAAYGSMKHRVNKTDARASEIFTPEVWDGWRERIDGTTNDKIGEMSEAIVADPTLTDEQRTAAMNYMEASLNLRGFNLASVANQRGGEMSEDEVAANESYMDGYSASSPQEMNDAKKMLDLQRQRLASALSEDLVQDFDNDPIGALSITHDPELRRIASDYVNAKMVYDGMIQRVRDDIDGRIARSDAMIDSRINRETGMLQPATVRDVDSSDGRRVYIVNGSVAMYDDGTGVDARKSSESIIIRDAETSKVEFADAARFLGVDEAIDAETEKEAAREQIRQEMAQAAANSIDGVLSFTPGDTYSILDAEGNQQPVTVLGNSVDEEGLPVDGSVDVQYADGTIQSVVTSELQQMVDAASTQRVEQFDQEREAQRATAEEAAQQAAQSGLSNPNRRTDLMPDDYEMPYDNRPVRASRYIESEKGTGGTLYQDENGNDAVVIAAIDDNNYVGYFREYDEQGNPTNRWSAKFQNGSGMRENHRDMMLTAQELLPAGHELTEHTSVSTDGLRNLANQLKHGYELQYDEQGNIITTEVAVNMMARENELGLSDYEAGSIDPARVTSEEYKEAAARLIPYMEALGLSKFNIHWEDGTLYVDHPILRRADTPQQEVEPTVTENAETVLNSAENTEIPTENRDLNTESVPKTDMPVGNVQQTADDGFIPIDPEIKPDENGVINIPSPGTAEGDTVLGAEASKPTALSRVPTDERGEPVYEDAEPDTAWDALVEQSEGDEDIAMEVAADIVAEKEKEYKAAERALKKAIEGKPETARGDGELTMAERIAAKKASKTAIVKARGDVEKTRSVLEHWQLIAGTMQRRVDAEKNAALQEQQQWEEAKNRMDKRVRETSEKYRDLPEVLNILEQTDPQSIDEVAAWVLSRYKVLWGSRRNGDTGNVVRAGVQHHTGIGEGERRRLFGLFASEANGGRSIESLAEDVFEEACNQFGVAYDNGQALDALIDVIKGATTRSDITNYIVNNRIARAETEGDALHRYYEDAEAADREYHERYGMGETEWMEFYASHGAEIELPDDVFQELMTNLGGLKADEEYERGEIQESAADTTGGGREESVYTEGTGVGSERWLDDHGDASRRETEGGTTRGELVQDSLDEGGGEQSEVRGNDENGEEDVFSRMERIARNETLRTDIRDAEAEVNTEPTDKQKEAGNYKKGHVQVGTFDVTIENPKGSKRSGRDTDGKQWETIMTHTYGYIRGTKGVDGDHIDVYLSSDIDGWNGRKAFVVDQYNPDGSFDEHKVMLGFNDKDEAFEAYLSNYETGWDNGRRLDVTAVNLEDFEKWIDSSKRKTKPIADYVNIKKAVSASSQGSVAKNVMPIRYDNMGNPIDAHGNLIIEDVESLNDISESDFVSPTRTIRLPHVPQNVSDAIGTNGRSIIIKKNIFVKNRDTHPELSPMDSRDILHRALYNPNLVGTTQPIRRPDYKVAIQTGDKNAVVVLDVYASKDNVEIVGWRKVDGKGLEKMKRQAEREGGQFLILSPNEGSAAALSALPSDVSSEGKDNAFFADNQISKDAKRLSADDFADNQISKDAKRLSADESADKHKVMLGFNNKDEAFEAYLSNYETGWDNGRRLDVTAVNLEDFEKWIDSSKRKTKPIADYVNIKKAVSASSQGSVADYKSVNNDNQSYSLINVVRDLYSKGKEYTSRLYQRSFFNVAKTPEFMKTLGLTGDNFTIRYGVIARHVGKDGSHDISEEEWEKLPDALTKPFAITKLSDKDKGFRLYTTLQNHNGEYIVVGVDVKNVGRDLEVNAIATVFGRRDNAGTTLQEEIIYTDKNITPEQQSLLDGPNSHQYTAERELSKDKVNALSANKQTDSKESSDGYRIEPKPYTHKQGKDITEPEQSSTPLKDVDRSGVYKSFLSEREYIDRKVEDAFINRKDKTQTREEWEDDDDYVPTYNRITDSYPDYIIGLKDRGELQRIYDAANIGGRIKIRKGVEDAGFDVHDMIDLEKEHQESKRKREKRKAERTKEIMKKIGIYTDGAEGMNQNDGELSETRFHAAMSRGDSDFDALRDRAVAERGIVMPGLRESQVDIVEIPRHDFTGTGKQAIKKARAWATSNLVGEHWYHKGGNDGFRYQIDEEAIDKYLSSSSTKGSDNLGIHLACLKRLSAIIDNSVEAEIHADYAKTNGKRATENGVQHSNILIHRYYGAVRIEGKLYRVKTTIKETLKRGITPYNYQVTELELLISGSETSDALSNSNRLDGTKLLKGVEKSYDAGVKLLEASEKVSIQGADEVAVQGQNSREDEQSEIEDISEETEEEEDDTRYRIDDLDERVAEYKSEYNSTTARIL